jgi:beta-lactamase regulating signal transducer with metallopeptidase domain
MLFLYFMKVSLLLAVLTLGYRWLIQFETFSKLNRALLWLNVLAAWSLPLIPLADWGPVEVQAEFHQTIPKIAKVVPEVRQEIATFNPAPSVLNRQHLPQWDIMNVISMIYLAGVACMVSVFLFQISGLLRQLWKSPSRKSENGVIFISDERNVSPYSFFKWVIYNPKNHAQSTLEHILAHETEHVLQWHSLDLLFTEIQRIVLWFNPFAWYHQRLVQANLEYLADKAVIDAGCEKKEYQFDLLRTVMQNRELPLTSSFAQSLLKKRIRMMNKKPSHYLVCGKYVMLIGLLYLSSAFVAPYTVKVAEFIPPMLIGTVMEEDQPVFAAIKDEDKKQEEAPKEIKPKSEKVISDSLPNDPEQKVKGILIKNDTLYWAISPLTTWDEISKIRKVINEFGGEIHINSLQYDPLQTYITSISVHTRAKGSSGSGSNGSGEFAPITGFSGYILVNGIGIGQLPPEPLYKEIQDDVKKALVLMDQNKISYFQYKLTKSLGPNSSTEFGPKIFEGKLAPEYLLKYGVGKSPDNTFLITKMYENADVYLNTKPSTLAELNTLPFDKLEKVGIIEETGGKKHVIIYAK